MDTSLRLYNLALEQISKGDLEKAASLLEGALQQNARESLLCWTMGLVQISLGNPHAGLQLWNRVHPNEVPGLIDKKAIIESYLPIYERLFAEYNEALRSVQELNCEQAASQLANLLAYSEEIALPIDIYYGYFLTLVMNGQAEQAAAEIANAPNYVRLSKQVALFQIRLDEFRKSNSKNTHVATYSKKIRYLSYASAVGFLIAAGSVAYVFSERVNSTRAMVAANADPNVPSLQNENKKLLDSIHHLQEQNKILQDVQSKSKSETDRLQQVVQLAGINQDRAVTAAALKSYETGIGLLRNGDAINAEANFEKSRQLQNDSYFADDNVYYLIIAKEKTNKMEEARKLYEEFLSNTSPNYRQSPYFDDILLAKAEDLLYQYKTGEAAPLLEQLINIYPNEWTANRAKQLRHMSQGAQ